MELPLIQKIYDKLKDQGLSMLLIQAAQKKEESRIIFKSSSYSPGAEKDIESQIKELLEMEKK